MRDNIKLLHGDCLDLMKDIPDKSIDMVLCDLPYGTTACKWDVVIPFEPLWEQYKRIIKDRGCIALFGSEPFSSYLRMSNIKDYKYDWIWNKTRGYNFQQANFSPMKSHELISVFSLSNDVYSSNSKTMNYFPQKKSGLKIKSGNGQNKSLNKNNMKYLNKVSDSRFPKTIIDFKKEIKSFHPTQKPVSLLEYLIKTYTLENETVLDNTMGSGSTGVACVNTNRNFIGIEKYENYFNIAKNRIDDAIHGHKQQLFKEAF